MIIALQLLTLMVVAVTAVFTWRNHMSLENLQREVAETNTVIDSAVAFIVGIKQELLDAIASGNPQALQTLADNLDAKQNELAAALVRNTPSDGETPQA